MIDRHALDVPLDACDRGFDQGVLHVEVLPVLDLAGVDTDAGSDDACPSHLDEVPGRKEGVLGRDPLAGVREHAALDDEAAREDLAHDLVDPDRVPFESGVANLGLVSGEVADH